MFLECEREGIGFLALPRSVIFYFSFHHDMAFCRPISLLPFSGSGCFDNLGCETQDGADRYGQPECNLIQGQETKRCLGEETAVGECKLTKLR